MKKKLVGLGVTTLVLGGVAFAWTQHDKPKLEMIDGTNVNAVSYTDKTFLDKLKNAYPQVYQRMDDKKEVGDYAIPGLSQTKAIYHKGKNKGQIGIAKDMDPQGIAIIEDKYLVISAYSKSKAFNSVLWVLDKKTGDFIKTISLDDIDHVGGMTYDEEHDRLWVTAFNKQKRAQLESLSLKAIEGYNLEKMAKPIPFENATDLDGIKLASYMTYRANKLYVGYFNPIAKGLLAVYDLDEQGLPIVDSQTKKAKPSRLLPTYEKVQGMAFYEDKILLSQSYGKTDSKLYIFDNKIDDPKFDLDKGDAVANLTLPPYLEQIVGYGDNVYMIFESASHKYRKNPNIIHMDRVIKLKIEDLYK